MKWTRRRPALAAGVGLLLIILALALVSLGAMGQLGKVEQARQQAADRAEAEQQAREKAVEQFQAALAAKAEAEEHRLTAVHSLERADRTLASNNVLRAHLAWQTGELEQAAQALDNCPAPLRGWEWRLVNALARPERQSFDSEGGPVRAVAVSPDGSLLASGGDDHKAILWEVKTGKPRHVFADLPSAVVGLTFDREGKTLGCLLAGDGVRVWDVKTGKSVATLKGRAATLDAKGSPDGRLSVVIRFDNGLEVMRQDRSLRVLRDGPTFVQAVAFSPDGRMLASGGSDSSVRLWDVESGKVKHTVWVTGEAVTRLAFSPDGRRLAALTGTSLGLFDAQDGRGLVPTVRVGSVRADVAFSPDGSEIAIADGGEYVRLFSPQTGGQTRRVHSGGNAHSLAFSQDGRLCVGGERGVRMIDLRYGSRQIELPSTEAWTTAPMAFSPDGTLAASADRIERVYLWDLTTARLKATLRGHDQVVRGLAFSADGKRLLSGGDDGAMKVWEVATGKPVLDVTAAGQLTAVAWDTKGTRLACAGSDHKVRLYDAKTGQPQHVLTAPAAVADLNFSPDGTRLAVADGTTVHLWESASGRALDGLTGQSRELTQARFGPDGATVVTASADHTLRLWNVGSRGQKSRVLKGHTAEVLAAAFSPDGARLATASNDRTVRIWDVRLGAEVLTLKDHNGVINSLAFSADNRRLVGGLAGKDRVHVWDVPAK